MKKRLKKREAINFVNKHTKTNLILNNSNTVFSNIVAGNVWWINIPRDKFDTAFNVVLVHNDKLSILRIPKNIMSEQRFCLRDDDYKYCLDIKIRSDKNRPDYMRDIRDNKTLYRSRGTRYKTCGTRYDFSQHIHEEITFPDRFRSFSAKAVSNSPPQNLGL